MIRRYFGRFDIFGEEKKRKISGLTKGKRKSTGEGRDREIRTGYAAYRKRINEPFLQAVSIRTKPRVLARMSRPFPNNMLSAQSVRQQEYRPTHLPTVFRYSGIPLLLIALSPRVNLLEVTTTPVTTIRRRRRRTRPSSSSWSSLSWSSSSRVPSA